MARAIFGLRIWLAFVCLINLAIVSTYYGWVIGTKSNTRQDSIGAPRYSYNWTDYGVIAFSVILFLSYVYSILVKRHLFHHRFVRAFLMLFPALFLLGIMFYSIHVQLKGAQFANETLREDYFMLRVDPFSCNGTKGESMSICAVMQSYIFVPIVTGVFVIIEVLVTLLRGPLHHPKADYY
ncbi:hypothetical protein BGZ96_002450 [Linnemannia gamsii]|uniref:Uncharacterized protein n=1 Tax=Linnemannia gamsii TaxID=64522 RepID=A0ABQ7JKY9_9FUNG|nr:hypothetical protein BGZ96_002450 [Linnemannia gamsii]